MACFSHFHQCLSSIVAHICWWQLIGSGSRLPPLKKTKKKIISFKTKRYCSCYNFNHQVHQFTSIFPFTYNITISFLILHLIHFRATISFLSSYYSTWLLTAKKINFFFSNILTTKPLLRLGAGAGNKSTNQERELFDKTNLVCMEIDRHAVN